MPLCICFPWSLSVPTLNLIKTGRVPLSVPCLRSICSSQFGFREAAPLNAREIGADILWLSLSCEQRHVIQGKKLPLHLGGREARCWWSVAEVSAGRVYALMMCCNLPAGGRIKRIKTYARRGCRYLIGVSCGKSRAHP